jgi:hypothetical protein
MTNLPDRDKKPRAPIRVLVAESNPHLSSVLCWVLSHDERFEVAAEVRDGDTAVASRRTTIWRSSTWRYSALVAAAQWPNSTAASPLQYLPFWLTPTPSIYAMPPKPKE